MFTVQPHWIRIEKMPYCAALALQKIILGTADQLILISIMAVAV
jgi:hypothetical protein